jgi:hypothetical protein
MRFILEQAQVTDLYLLDPLIKDYLKHPLCRYRHGRLGGLFNEHPTRFLAYARHPLLAWHVKRNDWQIGGWLGRPITLVDSMIESYQPDQLFDLLVIINVIEHCQDVISVMEKTYSLLASNGILIFHDKLYSADQTQRLSKLLYDAGHPLRVNGHVITQFLDDRFESILRNQYPVSAKFRGISWQHQNLYFIGEKR